MRRKKLIDDGIAMVLKELRERLYLPDPTPFYCVLAALVANRVLSGPPLQFMLVGPPSCGGTELLMMLGNCGKVHYVSRLTGESMLSGTSRKETAKGAKGGLLREVEDGDVMIIKDFTSILSMRPDVRQDVLGVLRDIGDGKYSRVVGTDGGRHLDWEGKLGILSKSTFKIDQYTAEISAMGDRFIYYRYPYADNDFHAATTAIHNFDSGEWEMTTLKEMVADFIEGVSAEEAPGLNRKEQHRIAAMAGVCSKARAGVERDFRSKEITYYDDAERSPRLSLYFTLMFKSLRLIGLVESEAWRVLREVAISTMHGAKTMILKHVMEHTRMNGGGGSCVNDLVSDIGYRRETTIRQMLDELEAHGVLVKVKGKADTLVGKLNGRSNDTWKLTQWAAEMWHMGWVD